MARVPFGTLALTLLPLLLCETLASQTFHSVPSLQASLPPNLHEETLASQTFHSVTSLQASLPPCELRLSSPSSRSSPSYSCKGGLLRKTPTSHGRHFIFYTRQTYVRSMYFIVGCRKLVPRECLHGVFASPLLPSIRENSASQIIQVRLAGNYPYG